MNAIAEESVEGKIIERLTAQLEEVSADREWFLQYMASNYGAPCVGSGFNWDCPLKDKRGLWSNSAGCPQDKVRREDCYLRFVQAQRKIMEARDKELMETVKRGQP